MKLRLTPASCSSLVVVFIALAKGECTAAIVRRLWNLERGAGEGCTFWVSRLGIWKKNGDGSPMSDMGRKYLVSNGYNDELENHS
jgi:hypothetical protein